MHQPDVCLNLVFNKYVNHLTWVYQGDRKNVDAKLYMQNGNVKSTLPAFKLETKKTSCQVSAVRYQQGKKEENMYV